MNIFRRKPQSAPRPAEPTQLPAITAEAEVRQAIHDGVERRRKQKSFSFSVLCVMPQAVGNVPEVPAETEAVTRNIATELRSDDRFCRLGDGSYLVLLTNTSDQFASVVAQRLAVNLTVRSAAVRRRKWLVGIAQYPHDAETESALIELAQADAAARQAA